MIPGSNTETVVRQLIVAKAKAKANEKAWKEEGIKIDKQLAEILNPEEILKAAGKDKSGGSTTTELFGGKFVVESEKKIKWDSTKLQNIAAGMPWAAVQSIFKIKFEIGETKYKDLVENSKGGLFDAKILAKINDARAVEIGEAKIKAAELITQP